MLFPTISNEGRAKTKEKAEAKNTPLSQKHTACTTIKILGVYRKTHLRLKEADEEEDLHRAIKGDLRQGGDAVGHVGERETRRGGQHAREAEVLCGDVAEDGEHGNAPVLHLHVPEAVEALLQGSAVGKVLGTTGLPYGVVEYIKQRGHTPTRRRKRQKIYSIYIWVRILSSATIVPTDLLTSTVHHLRNLSHMYIHLYTRIENYTNLRCLADCRRGQIPNSLL